VLGRGLVCPTNTRRAWPAAVGRWAASHRQIIEQVIAQLKDLFAL
jgi:hypothetical protein